MNVIDKIVKKNWTEKYRPIRLVDMVLPKYISEFVEGVIKSGASNIPHMIFSGSPGIGKTTLASVIGRECDMTEMYINASIDGNIDQFKVKIMNFMTTSSLNGKRKLLIIDEADRLNPISTQPAMRIPLEKYAENCLVIFVTNDSEAMIEAVKSRTTEIKFKIPEDEKLEILEKYAQALSNILKIENIKFNQDTLDTYVMKYFPDFRKTLNEISNLVLSNNISKPIEDKVTIVIPDIFEHLKKKDFNKMQRWVIINTESNPENIFRILYDNMKKYVEKESIQVFVLIVADYQYKSALVNDKEINLVACMTQLMQECKFK